MSSTHGDMAVNVPGKKGFKLLPALYTKNFAATLYTSRVAIEFFQKQELLQIEDSPPAFFYSRLGAPTRAIAESFYSGFKHGVSVGFDLMENETAKNWIERNHWKPLCHEIEYAMTQSWMFEDLHPIYKTMAPLANTTAKWRIQKLGYEAGLGWASDATDAWELYECEANSEEEIFVATFTKLSLEEKCILLTPSTKHKQLERSYRASQKRFCVAKKHVYAVKPAGKFDTRNTDFGTRRSDFFAPERLSSYEDTTVSSDAADALLSEEKRIDFKPKHLRRTRPKLMDQTLIIRSNPFACIQCIGDDMNDLAHHLENVQFETSNAAAMEEVTAMEVQERAAARQETSGKVANMPFFEDGDSEEDDDDTTSIIPVTTVHVPAVSGTGIPVAQFKELTPDTSRPQVRPASRSLHHIPRVVKVDTLRKVLSESSAMARRRKNRPGCPSTRSAILMSTATAVRAREQRRRTRTIRAFSEAPRAGKKIDKDAIKSTSESDYAPTLQQTAPGPADNLPNYTDDGAELSPYSSHRRNSSSSEELGHETGNMTPEEVSPAADNENANGIDPNRIVENMKVEFARDELSRALTHLDVAAQEDDEEGDAYEAELQIDQSAEADIETVPSGPQTSITTAGRQISSKFKPYILNPYANTKRNMAIDEGDEEETDGMAQMGEQNAAQEDVYNTGHFFTDSIGNPRLGISSVLRFKNPVVHDVKLTIEDQVHIRGGLAVLSHRKRVRAQQNADRKRKEVKKVLSKAAAWKDPPDNAVNAYRLGRDSPGA